MSWLARSLVNSLRDHAGDDPDSPRRSEVRSSADPAAAGEDDQEPGSPTRGVKEDLSQLTKTLTRQFWGVASFLAPPPDSSSPPSDPSDSAVDSPRVTGIRSDFAEIGGKFRTGISILSKNKAVSEISKIASSFLTFEEEGEEEEVEEWGEGVGGGAVGVTDEVLAFARNISMHPETWLDFPLITDEEDSDDFDMSDAQQEHALAVERLAPRLAALRIELCPSHMSEGCFWKIYFVLLHPRLTKHDAELLSTPQIVQARALLLQDLQNRTKPNSEVSGRGVSYRTEVASSVPSEERVVLPSTTISEVASSKVIKSDDPITFSPITDLETDKHPVQATEVKIVDKSVIEEDRPVQNKARDFKSDVSSISIQNYEEEGDDWLEEDTDEISGSKGTAIPLGNEEDVSFSDLEEDDDQDAPTNSSTKIHAAGSQPKDSKGSWVELNKSSDGAVKGGNNASPQNKESNDWLNFDDLDDD